MRRTNRDRPPAVRPKLAFEPLEPRELLAADVGLDWWSTDPAAESAPTDDWVWAFDDGWNFGWDGGDPTGTDGWGVGDGAADPATDDVAATDTPDPENVTPMPGGEDFTAAVVDTPAPPVEDVATSADDGAEPDSDVTDGPVVDEGTVILDDPLVVDDPPVVDEPVIDDGPVIDDESPVVIDDQPVIEDGPATDMPVIDDGPTTDPFDDTGTVHDATGDATPTADPTDGATSPTPEPVAGPDPVPSGPVSVPDVPKAADGEPAGPQATVMTGPGSAASQPGPTVVVPLPAPTGVGGRAAGPWGAFLGMFGLPANAAASPATGLPTSGQDGTGKPRVRLPFRPIA